MPRAPRSARFCGKNSKQRRGPMVDQPDIVTRLQADRETLTHDPNIVQVSPPSSLALEAATEIGRLRAQIAAWEAHARLHGCVKLETLN